MSLGENGSYCSFWVAHFIAAFTNFYRMHINVFLEQVNRIKSVESSYMHGRLRGPTDGFGCENLYKNWF